MTGIAVLAACGGEEGVDSGLGRGGEALHNAECLAVHATIDGGAGFQREVR
ncbi:MAG: hypothetical protein ACI9K2_006190 [Myxococcota bacterium]|jgi:hypothetical protein